MERDIGNLLTHNSAGMISLFKCTNKLFFQLRKTQRLLDSEDRRDEKQLRKEERKAEKQIRKTNKQIKKLERKDN